MRNRPVRPLIYQPIIRFGIHDRDRWWVGVVTFLGYVVPSQLGWTVYGVPVAFVGWFVVLLAVVSFLNWARLNRPPAWLQHTVAASPQPNRRRGMTPNDFGKSSWTR